MVANCGSKNNKNSVLHQINLSSNDMHQIIIYHFRKLRELKRSWDGRDVFLNFQTVVV